jgi:hypothetical protein
MLNLHELGSESFVEQAISLIKNKGVQLWRSNTAGGIREEILESAGCRDKDMATLPLKLMQSSPLHGTTHSDLYLQTCPSDQAFCLNCDLLGQLSRGRNDDCSNIDRGNSPAVAVTRLKETAIAKELLNNGNQKSNGFTGTGLSLSQP